VPAFRRLVLPSFQMNRELLVIALVVFVTSLFTRSVDPVVPLIADGMVVQVGTAALLSTAFALPYALVQPPLGALADMMSKTRLMSICLVLLVLSAFISAVAPNFTVLFASRVLAGVASGGIFPTSLALAGDRIPVAQRQVAISRLLAATMTGNLLGASVAGIVGDLAGWRAVFLVVGGLGLIVVTVALIGFRSSQQEKTTGFDLATLGPNYRAIFGNPLAKICFGAVFVEALVVFGIFPHMAAIMSEAGETRASIAGIVLAGFGIGAVFYAFCVAWMLRTLGERKLMIGGGLMMGAFCLILTLRLPWPLEFLNFVLLGFGFYWLHGSIQIYATELAPQARGSAMALHSASFFLGQAAGPVIYGIGFAKIGMTPVLIIGAILVAAVGFVCSRKLRRTAVATT
jgi:predicted MFS family arabinose efflux permease